VPPDTAQHAIERVVVASAGHRTPSFARRTGRNPTRIYRKFHDRARRWRGAREAAMTNLAGPEFLTSAKLIFFAEVACCPCPGAGGDGCPVPLDLSPRVEGNFSLSDFRFGIVKPAVAAPSRRARIIAASGLVQAGETSRRREVL
jgi:hypothetical protein